MSSPGIAIWFPCFFCFLDSETFVDYRAERRKQKNQRNQSLGKNVVPKDFLQGIGFFGFFVFFLFSLKFFGFGYMILCGICPT